MIPFFYKCKIFQISHTATIYIHGTVFLQMSNTISCDVEIVSVQSASICFGSDPMNISLIVSVQSASICLGSDPMNISLIGSVRSARICFGSDPMNISLIGSVQSASICFGSAPMNISLIQNIGKYSAHILYFVFIFKVLTAAGE